MMMVMLTMYGCDGDYDYDSDEGSTLLLVMMWTTCHNLNSNQGRRGSYLDDRETY